MPDSSSTDSASSKPLRVARLMLGISANTMGVKSIGSNRLRVNGSMDMCGATASWSRCSKVVNSRPLMASAVIRLG
ncbi:hypothetical protein D3C86_2051150 [compost metagenome]